MDYLPYSPAHNHTITYTRRTDYQRSLLTSAQGFLVDEDIDQKLTVLVTDGLYA